MGEVVEYGYSIFEYARKYDKDWILEIEKIRRLLLVQKLSVQVPVKLSVSENFHDDQDNLSTNRHPAMPNESVYMMMSYLSDEDLLVASTVCRSWNILANEDELWANLLLSKFSVSPIDIAIKRSRYAFHRCHGYYLCPSKRIFKEMQTALKSILTLNNGNKMTHTRNSMLSTPVVPSYMLQYSVAVN